MKPAPGLARAPKRGLYDRTVGRGARQSAQRERVLTTLMALVGSEQALNITNIIQLAGIGRNTFYEYFDDIEHALAVLSARALRDFSTRLELAARGTRTPTERLRALARAWAEHLVETPALARVALRPQPATVLGTQMSALATQLQKMLETMSATFSALAEPFRSLAVAALFEAVSRSHFASTPLPAVELERVLFDLAERLLR